MKYAIILPDGASDEPLPQLDGRTPLEVANTPNMDWVAEHGRIGRSVTVPTGFISGTDVATLSIFGYDPNVHYSGRAPIEAVARGLTAGPGELIFRSNFVTILDGLMKDFTAGHIAQSETDRLIADLNALFEKDPCRFHAGVSYRNLMIGSGAGYGKLICAPPHDIPDQPVAEHQPHGDGAAWVREVMARASEMLRDHEVNRMRRETGKSPVTDIWLWGQGTPTKLEPFESRFGCSGTVITGVDIIRGLAVSMGMKLIEVDGATGYIDTNYVGKGEAAVRAVDEYDLVVVHVEAPDEAGHLGDADLKVEAIEQVDRHVVGPVLDAIRRHDAWKILIAPDHPTPVLTKAHSPVPPPFCFAGSSIDAVEKKPFTERNAETGPMIDPGYELIELFFRS